MSKLTSEDKELIAYFFFNKGDVTRWCDWEEKKAQVKNEYPHVIFSLDNLKLAEDTLEQAIKDMTND